MTYDISEIIREAIKKSTPDVRRMVHQNKKKYRGRKRWNKR